MQKKIGKEKKGFWRSDVSTKKKSREKG